MDTIASSRITSRCPSGRFDLGVRYACENPGAKDKLLVARFNVENVLDADYWQSGRASTVLFSAIPVLSACL